MGNKNFKEKDFNIVGQFSKKLENLLAFKILNLIGLFVVQSSVSQIP